MLSRKVSKLATIVRGENVPKCGHMSDTKPLTGKKAIVTGASSGIGRGIAVALGQAGADVAIHHFGDLGGAEKTAATIAEFGGKTTIVDGDLRVVSQIETFVKRAIADLGGLNVLINNAGITGWNAALDVDEALWDTVIDTNLKGTFFCAIAAAGHMQTNGGGSIVNISSVLSHSAMRNLTIYAASKAGINQMTRQLALELGPLGIRVNAIAPGPVVVDRTLADDPDYEKNWGDMTLVGRAGRPADVGAMAVFLNSAAADWVSGQILTLDGGLTVAARVPETSMDLGLKRNR